MRILIPVMKFGREGGFRVLSNLANEFIDKGHEVHFVASVYSALPYFPTKGSIYWSDIKGNFHDKPQEVKRGWTVIKSFYNGIKKISKKNNYDIILANQSFSTYPIFFAKANCKVFYYIQAYEPDFYAEKKGLQNRILAFLSKMSYRFSFDQIVNGPAYDMYLHINTQKQVYPGLDLMNFHVKETPFIKPSKKWIIGTIGRLEPIKGTKYIIEAYKTLRESRDDIELVIAFGQDEWTDVPKEIKVIRPDGDKNLADFYRSIDIYVCAGTGQHGAIHYPILESMASGTAVVTTPYYPANENNSWIIKPNNSLEIVKGITMVIDSQEEFIKKKKNAIESVQEFDWEIVSKKMLSYFDQSLK
jgi:glycosyltransferase involved in cell wall biosynthesis